MRIGLFTDTYRPSINGIVYVVDSLKRELEAEGHEVFIFCPARSIRRNTHSESPEEDEYIIRFPSIKGAFYDDYDTSLFFPPRVLSKIKDLELDVIHFFTPGQVGIMGVYAAHKTNTPLIAQHCTDLRQYVEHYTDGALLPGLLALMAVLPFTVKVNGKDLREIMSLYKPRRERVQWNIDIVERIVTLVYSKCDGVIALSRKSKDQLESWQHSDNYTYPVTLLPNGVTEIPPATSQQISDFMTTYGIAPDDEVFGFVGRLGAEKNLALLIPALEQILLRRPKARLMFVGDFEFREALEQMASESSCPERITFTGALPRKTLGAAYGAMDVFVFPSLTDTQGWVIHEAAQAGLPLVLIDTELSEVLQEGKNGLYADNSSEGVARAVLELLENDEMRRAFGSESQKIVQGMSEKSQIQKLIAFYDDVVDRHTASLLE